MHREIIDLEKVQVINQILSLNISGGGTASSKHEENNYGHILKETAISIKIVTVVVKREINIYYLMWSRMHYMMLMLMSNFVQNEVDVILWLNP